jgi:voltage-dependent calcium channel
LNLIYFVFLLNWIAAILASQLFRGQVPALGIDGSQLNVTFFTIWNSFIGMYQVFSSENWTSIVYSVTAADVGFNTAWIGAAFFILWFILANCKPPPFNNKQLIWR